MTPVYGDQVGAVGGSTSLTKSELISQKSPRCRHHLAVCIWCSRVPEAEGYTPCGLTPELRKPEDFLLPYLITGVTRACAA